MKWGLITYGTITPKFLRSLHSVETEELVAIASRSNDQAAKRDYPDVKVYTSYEDLFQDEEVEVVYISSTHNNHFSQAKSALLAGKHVLCEKPMTTSLRDTTVLCELAKSQNLFLMEAVWTRFMPAYKKVKELLRDHYIGDIKYIHANFSFKSPWGEDRRLLNKDLAGGGTYDVGIYNIALATDLLGNHPLSISSQAIMADTGVDESCLTTLQYPHALASLYCGIQMDTDHQAIIYGEEGKIIMERHWKVDTIIVFKGNRRETIHIPFESSGYAHEIRAVSAAIQAGKLESEIMPHEDSIAIAGIIDQVLTDIQYK